MLDYTTAESERGSVHEVLYTTSQEPRSRAAPPVFAIEHVPDLELVVVSKRRAGFDRADVDALRTLLTDLATGRTGPCKFLVMDFAVAGAGSRSVPGFDDLIAAVGNLIFEAPVISVAWVRDTLVGPDLEFGLACSMIVCEPDAGFTFDTDVLDSFRSYSLLAHKLGFVQAERLMESGVTLGAEAMYEGLLAHALEPARPGLDGIRQFVKARTRRHNSACGIYRAQRIAMGA